MNKLIKRVKAEETKFGKVLAYYIPILLGFTAGVVETLELLDTMPFEIPFDTKKIIGICTLIGFFGGKLTKKNEPQG